MSINLRMQEKNIDDVEQIKLHYMPCKINGDESANVSKFFEPYIRKITENEFKASFRGHPLEGKEMLVPEGYKGVTISEYKKPDSEMENRNLYVTGIFTKFNYWNYDKTPSNSDALTKALDWVDFAASLHSPVDEED